MTCYFTDLFSSREEAAVRIFANHVGKKKNTQIGEIATEPPPLKNVKEIIKYIVQYENFVEKKALFPPSSCGIREQHWECIYSNLSKVAIFSESPEASFKMVTL